MRNPFYPLLEDVQAREKRNRGIALLFVIISLATSIALLYVVTRFYPRWCAYVAIPLVPVTLYWVARSGLRSLNVSRLEAAALIDSKLDTRARGVTLVELQQAQEPAREPHIALLAQQLAHLIPFTTTSKIVNPYSLGLTERRAIIASVIALILFSLFLLFRPLSPREEIALEIESALTSSPELEPRVQEMAKRVIETMRNPNSSTSELQSAIRDAKLALVNSSSTTQRDSSTPLVLPPSSRQGASAARPTIEPSPSTSGSEPATKDAPKPPPAAPSQQSNSQRQNDPQQQQQSQEKGAGQQRSGEGNQDDNASESSQSDQQKDSSNNGDSSEESQEQSQSGESGKNQSEQSSEQQSGGSQGSGSGKGSAGSDPSQDSQEESSGGGAGAGKSGKGRGEQKEGGKQQGASGSSGGTEQGDSGGQSSSQQLSQALDKAEQSLKAESEGKGGNSSSSSDSKGESTKDAASQSNTKDMKEMPSGSQGGDKDKTDNNTSGQKPSGEPAKGQDRGSKDQSGASKGAGGDNSKRSPKESEGSSSDAKSETTPANENKESPRQGSLGDSQQGETTPEQKEEQPSNTSGNRDGKGERSRVVEGKATPRHYEEGGPDGPPGPGLGGKEGFKDLQVGNAQESFDARFTGQDATEAEGKGPAQPKTTIEDLTLSKPKASVERGEQRIPLEYRDILN